MIPGWFCCSTAALLVALMSASPGVALSPSAIELELPDLGDERHAPGIIRLLEPEKIRKLVFHIPVPAIKTAYPRINTIGTGLVQGMRVRRDEVLYDVDLLRHEGRYYELSAADNTIEIEVALAGQSERVIARWVIARPKEPISWQKHQSIAVVQTEPGASKIEILEELGPDERRELLQPLTTASRVMFRASFPRAAPEWSLSLQWQGADGVAKTRSVGWNTSEGAPRSAVRLKSSGQLTASIDLAVGKTRVEVEVAHGYTVVSKSTFELLRRAPTEPLAVTGDKWAVVVGVSDYQAAGLDLRFAHRDAEVVAKALVELAGFPEERVRLLTNDKATIREVKSALSTFLAATKPNDLVVIFLAGHGVPDPQNSDNFYFLAHDSVLDDLGGTALPMWDLDSAMDYQIRAQKVVVLADTCHSGAITDRSSAGSISLNFFNKYLEALAREKGRLVITASQAHELSRESVASEHGVFTEALLSGLRGPADDNPADGIVTAGEILDHLRSSIPETSRGEQHPSASHTGFDLNLPLARVASAKIKQQPGSSSKPMKR